MRLWSAITLLLVLLLSAAGYVYLSPNRQIGWFETIPPTPYYRYGVLGEMKGRVLVVHGLDSNKNVGNLLSSSLSEAGFEVFAIDLPGHGDSPAGFDALIARRVLADVLEKLGPETAVVGHSMGGALLLDIANDHRIANMVLFSPAPTPLESVEADRVLLIEGYFDPGRIRAFVPTLKASVTGTVEFHELPWGGHSSGLFMPAVIRTVATWLGGHTETIRIEWRIALFIVMFVASIGLGVALISNIRAPLDEIAPPGILWPRIILGYIAAGILAAGILVFVPIASWLRLFAMDYLIGFLFLAGLTVWLLGPRVVFAMRPIVIAVCSAAYVVLVPGILIGSQIVHLSLSSGRWWRFLAILLLTLPLFLADELRIRPMRGFKAFAVAATTRILLGAIAVTGVLIFNRHAAFLMLLAHFIVLFWIMLWLAGGIVRKRIGDAFSTALFIGLIHAWVCAAVFVIQ